jgi:hypothetical protein
LLLGFSAGAWCVLADINLGFARFSILFASVWILKHAIPNIFSLYYQYLLTFSREKLPPFVVSCLSILFIYFWFYLLPT